MTLRRLLVVLVTLVTALWLMSCCAEYIPTAAALIRGGSQ